MYYKSELEKYLSTSQSKINLSNNDTAIFNDELKSDFKKSIYDESVILPTRNYNNLIEECLNFDEIDTKKVI